MKRFALATACLSVAAVGTGYAYAHPAEFMEYRGRAEAAAVKAWDGVAANPGPVVFALATFLFTVVYHTARGKTLRESVEVAATRVTVIPVPQPAAAPLPPTVEEPAVVRRAKARATRTQLIADQIGLENRQKHLPAVVTAAEKDVCYAQQAVTEADHAVKVKRKTLLEAVARLKAVRAEKEVGDAELTAIAAELKKLAEVV